jgi:hypothetical protein
MEYAAERRRFRHPTALSMSVRQRTRNAAEQVSALLVAHDAGSPQLLTYRFQLPYCVFIQQ